MLPYARKNHQVATDGKTVYISGGDIFGKVHANVWYEGTYWDLYFIFLSIIVIMQLLNCNQFDQNS